MIGMKVHDGGFFFVVVDILLAVEANDDGVVGVEGLWINNTRF